jgi:DNA excision repair protein ERCC-4
VKEGRSQRPTPRARLSMLAPYLETIVSELDGDNSLLILARGLGLHAVLQNLAEKYRQPQELVLVLNTSQEEERQLLLGLVKADASAAPPAVLNNECTAQDRVELYRAGGVVLVTARILVVDMLCDRVPIEQVTGVVVANSHRVTEGSNVAFIMRIFRQRNKTAFVKALSDDAHAFTRGFAKVEKVMRMLKVRKLHLWPRFHLSVKAVLDGCQPIVEEITVPLSGRGLKLQHALLEAVDECLKELRGLNQSVDVSQFSVENALFKSFDTIVRQQLEPVWYRTSKRTRALVSDLQTLRKLLNFLVSLDCISFFEYLETVFDAASSLHPSERPHWILNCSETVWQLSRDRVYELQRTQLVISAAPGNAEPIGEARDEAPEGPESTRQCAEARLQSTASGARSGAGPAESGGTDASTTTAASTSAAAAAEGAPARPPGLSASVAPVSGAKQAPPLSVRCVLEESPKWAALRDLLLEINEKRAAGTPGGTLLVVRDERTGSMVREFMAHGAKPLLEATFIRWVGRRRRAQQQMSTVLSSRQHEARLLRAAADRLAMRHAHQEAPPPALHPVDIPDPHAQHEQPAAGAFGVLNSGGEVVSNRGAQRGGGRSRGRSGGARGIRGGGSGSAGRRQKQSSTTRAGGNANGASSSSAGAMGGIGALGVSTSAHTTAIPDAIEMDQASIAAHFALLEDPDESTVICTHSAGANEVLDELQPRYVVLYDPDPGFVRAIELAQAMRPSVQIYVYFMMQQNSVEEQRYRSALRIEREAFQALILEKGRLVIAEDWDEPPAVPRLPGEASASSVGDGNQLSRRGGSRPQATLQTSVVIVDVREFRSALPNMLHLHGMEVKPMTLEIGDYILSPDICVERKAIADLIQSLGSGRLFNQAEAMLRYYKRPALLIECEEGRPFGLINPSELGSEITPQSIVSKLSLLLLHFPKLRVLWSRSAAHTVAIFASLKQGQSEPDAATAAAVGLPTAPGADQMFSMAPQDFLRQLPGVFPHNYRRLMNAVSNLQELATKSLDELSKIIGAQNGRLLHEALHREA